MRMTAVQQDQRRGLTLDVKICVYRRHILTPKVDARAEKVKQWLLFPFFTAVFVRTLSCSDYYFIITRMNVNKVLTTFTLVLFLSNLFVVFCIVIHCYHGLYSITFSQI